MKILCASILVLALSSIPAISAPAGATGPGQGTTSPRGSFVNGTWDIKDGSGNKTGTAVINKPIGETGTITVTDTNGNTYTGTVTSAGSGYMSYSLSPAGSPMGSSGQIVQTGTAGTLSFNNFNIPGTDSDGTLSH